MLPRALPLALLSLGLVLPTAAQEPPQFERPSENVALGASYTLSPNPSYALCRDAGDATQLTDGEYTAGYFWTTATTVGWGAAHEPLIAIDLGQARAIRGLSYHTAAGRAGVFWPHSISLFVSDDGQQWHGVGDLVALDRKRGGTLPEEYDTYRFWTADLQTHGRYVALAIQPTEAYTFCDEIEVYAGDPAWLNQPLTGPAMDGLEAARIRRRAVGDVEAQVATLRERLPALNEADRNRIGAQLDQAADGVGGIDVPGADRAVPPYGAAHQAVLDVNAAIEVALGSPLVVLWQTNKWDPIEMIQEPPSKPEAPLLDYAMMRHEVRGEALIISNFGPHPIEVTASVAGVPEEAVTLRQAVWTAVKDAAPMASALPELTGPLTVETGLNRQLWVQVDSESLQPGDYPGQLHLAIRTATGATEQREVPLNVHVATLALPAKPSLALGGWDYTNSPHRGVTTDNVDQVVQFLRSYDLDAPWATSGALPFGQHDAAGALTTPPSTDNLDTWIDRWPDAKYYCVFVSTEENIDEDPNGQRKVGEWIRFWANHLRERKVDPAKLVLLIVDETRSVEQDAIIAAWSKAIKKVEPEVKIFNDPIWVDPREATAAMLEASDFLCPNRVRWLEKPEEYQAVYLTQQAAGRQLMYYSCSGPVRRLDPYFYHLLQEWHCFKVGAVATMFWAFGDNGGGTAWNEYVTPGRVYSPQMLGPEGCVTAKPMEAIREGRQDYDYLVMLRAAVAAGKGGAAAKKLLDEAPDRVLGEPDPASITWQRPADRGESERVRREILAVLEQVAG